MLAFQERAVVYAELNRLRRAHGAAVFPFIKTSFHPNLDESLIIDPPIDGAEVASSGGARGGVVVKSGTTCAGYGKMRLTSESDFIDFKTTLSMGSDYFTVERAVEVVADLRVQIVGDTTRVYKRSSDTWKGVSAIALLSCIRLPAASFLPRVLASALYLALSFFLSLSLSLLLHCAASILRATSRRAM